MEQKSESVTSHADRNICEHGHALEPDKKAGKEALGLWPRSLVWTWTSTLLLVTCLLHWARMAMPVCAATMAKQFGWNKKESGLVLGVFYWGYCFTQVLGGYVSDKIGGERVLIISTSSWAVMTAITPLLVNLGLPPLITITVARFLMGVLQGVHYPSLNSICAQRVAEGERGFLMSMLGCGCYLGILMVGGTGVCHAGLARLGKCVLCTWSLLCAMGIFCMEVSTQRAMFFAHICHTSAHFTLLSWLPTFFDDTYPNAKNWVFNVIPWLVALPISVLGGCVSDYLIKEGFGAATVRKIMQFCAMGLSSVFIYLLCKATTFLHAVVFVTAAFGLSTFNSSGVAVNVHDLAPSCAGALFGVMNTCAAFASLLMVYITGHMIEITGSWLTVFGQLVLVNIFGVVVFIIFGKAEQLDQVDQTSKTFI